MLSGMGNQHEWHGQDTSQLLPRLRPRLVVNAVFPRDLPRCHQRFSQVRRLQGSRRARHAGNSAAAPSDAATDFRKCQRFIADFCLASEASGRPTMLSTKPPLSLSAGTDWTLCCRPLRMERGTYSSGPIEPTEAGTGSRRTGAAAAANRTADSLAIPNRREHTLLGPCFLPLQ
jgi:hypothetical protein